MFPWPMFLLSGAAHHGEAADPRLLGWIKHLLDQMVTVGPWAVVVGLGFVLAAIPLAVIAVYFLQRGRRSGGLGEDA